MRSNRAGARQGGAGGLGCLIALGVGIVLVTACGYFGFRWSTRVLEDTVREELADNPVILEHIGELLEVKVDWMAVDPEKEDGRLSFDLRGSKGSARLIVQVAEEHTEGAGEGEEGDKMITAGILEFPSGETHRIFPEPPVPGPAEAPESALPPVPVGR